MSLTVAILKEQLEDEARVAATPDTVKKMLALGCAVTLEKGAGERAALPDSLYGDAGASVKAGAEKAVDKADIVLCVRRPGESVLRAMKKNAALIGILEPHGAPDQIALWAESGIRAMAMELIPRITRAQAMDVLSSQSNLAGYRAVIEAVSHYGRVFPMMMTAAGTVAPARVFVMGAGVAGLQAIATARRLGAVVSATDVRPAAKEQVNSLGASFVAVEDEEFKQAETAGGYAREMSEDYKKKQADLVAETLKKQDVVITTALIPGRPAPRLITKEMVETMKPGAVIVDLAVETGGNCEISRPGKVVEHKGVSIIGHRNLAARLAGDASALYARNLLALLGLMIDKENKALSIDDEDEIIRGITITRDGKAVHPNFQDAPKMADKPKARKAPAEKAANKDDSKDKES